MRSDGFWSALFEGIRFDQFSSLEVPPPAQPAQGLNLASRTRRAGGDSTSDPGQTEGVFGPIKV